MYEKEICRNRDATRELGLKNFINQRAETILEVTVGLFILSIAFSTYSLMSSRALSIQHESALRAIAEDIAENLLTDVEVIIGTNRLRYADQDCFDLIDPVAGCSGTPTRMNGTYASHFDVSNLTPALILAEPSDLSVGAVLERLPNDSSFHLVGTDAGADVKIMTGNMSGSEPTNFYGQVNIDKIPTSIGDYSQNVVTARAIVKWPIRSRVHTFQRSRTFAPHN